MVTSKSTGLSVKKAVVDTGPLFALLTLVFVRQAPHFRRLMFYKNAPKPYVLERERDYLDFFHSISEILFKSHVVGEIKSRHKVPSAITREFWLSSMAYLRQKRVDEKLLTLISLREDEFTSDLVCSLGPVDAGLLALARAENCVLLTDESGLLSRCDRAGKPDIQLVEYLL